ncbi:C-Maf-inducing protein-like [Sycon ciliatum]|uniref:C-Maf-inducing protein-like n=1 Tax=Sycon ciliatum TaxID=27933 RepID=UPI0020AE2794|eukprot:scpid40124/ scgid7887/ C-Maf-inducing protein
MQAAAGVRRTASLGEERPSYSLAREGNVCCFLRVHEVALLPAANRRLPCSDRDRAHNRSRRRRFFSCSSNSDRTVENRMRTYWLEVRDDGLWLRQDGVDYLLSYSDFTSLSRKRQTSGGSSKQQQIVIETSYGDYYLQLQSNHEREQWYYSLQYKRMLSDMRWALKGEQKSQQAKLDLMKLCSDYQATGKIRCDDTREEFLDCVCHYITDTRIPPMFMKVIVPMLASTLSSLRPPDVVCHFLKKHMTSIINTDFQWYLDSMIINLFKLPLLNDHKCSQGEFELLVSYFRVMHNCNKDAELRELIHRLHGASKHLACPFPIVFARLREMVIMSCTAAYKEDEELKKLSLLAVCGLIVEEALQYDDWREKMAVLKPRDFPDEALSDHSAGRWMSTFVRQLALDDRLGVRLSLTRLNATHSPDWLQHFRIGSPLCTLAESHELFCTLVQALSCTEGNFKRVLANFATVRDSLAILARKNNTFALQALVDLVRYQEITDADEVERIKAVLREGNHHNHLNQLASSQAAVEEVDGPVEILELPCGSTSEDLRKALTKHTKNLRIADLTSTRCGTDAMRMLSHYPNLTEVRLWSTPVGDQGIRILCDKLNLKKLDLRDTHITPTCFIDLVQMNNLETLYMSCQNYKRHAFEYLARRLPNLKTFEVNDLVDFDFLSGRQVELVRPLSCPGSTPSRVRRPTFNRAASVL